MYQAITTRFIAPTNTKGAKIVAECAAKTKRFSYYELQLAINNLPMTVNKMDVHLLAATKLANELGWLSDGWVLVSGTVKNGNNVHVLYHKGG